MKWDTREPCGSCPYRRDARLGLWHPCEFENLVEQDRDPMNGGVFGCHATAKADQPSVCAGWLLDQKRRNVPSIQLRLMLMRDKDAVACFEAVTDGGHALYGSIGEMVMANQELGICLRCGSFCAQDEGDPASNQRLFCSGDCERWWTEHSG